MSNASDQLPEGYHYEWIPQHSLPNGSRWQLLPEPNRFYGCRHTTGPGKAQCREPSIARLNRRTYNGKDRWWHYCEQHLYGQRIRDGILETRVLLPDNQEEGAP